MAQFSNQGSALDAWIYDGIPDTNYGSHASLYVGDKGVNVSRFLIKWDLSSIPSNATVSDATLSLVAADTSDHANTRTLRAYRVKRAWTEAQVTWNSYITGSGWGTAGCGNTSTDREATDVGNVSVPDAITNGTTVDITLTASAVQEMISGAFTNNGWLLQYDTENEDLTDFASTQHTTSSYRPSLVINYTVSTANNNNLLLMGAG